ncbi:MAG: methyl-accepting chemotaxis protein [Desulfurivibrio sp.]|nr:methyl-accepting chemotaxis protein [Desulfurivibrio sp.]
MGFFGNLTIQKRLILVLAVPLIFLSVILIRELVVNYYQLRQAQATVEVAHIAVDAAAIAHELQKERSLSDAFLGSRGERMGNELSSQRTATDAKITNFRNLTAEIKRSSLTPELLSQVERTGNQLNKLGDLRGRIDNLAIGGGESFMAYAEVLAEVRTTVRLVSQDIPNEELMRLIAGHYNFLEFMMRLNGEQLLLSNTFANNEFAPLAFMRFAESLAEQKVYLESFQTLADPEIREFYQQQQNQPAVRQVSELRQVAIEHRFGGGFNIDPKRWQQAISGMIEAMNKVEERLVTDYRQAGEQYIHNSQMDLLLKFGVGFVIWWTSAIAAFLVSRALVRKLNLISEDINDGTSQVTTAAHQLSATSQAVADSSSQQAASLEETSASVEEMSSMINRDADNTLQADSLMREANEVLSHADESMKKLVTSMNEINAASEETQKIVKTIDEIAFQTNLLALNAAVEAARAGEAGAGFAVVADEVRNLALRAAEAAQNTSTLIEGTVEKVKAGTSLVDETGNSFTKAHSAVEKIAVLLAEIAAAAREEADAVGQVNNAISQIDQATQDNAASAEETASASEELSGQVESIEQRVAELLVLIGKHEQTKGERPDRNSRRPTPAPRQEGGQRETNSSRPALPAGRENRSTSAGTSQKQQPKKQQPKQESTSEPFDDF